MIGWNLLSAFSVHDHEADNAGLLLCRDDGGGVAERVFQRVRGKPGCDMPWEFLQASLQNGFDGVAIFARVRPDFPSGSVMGLKCHA